jgi:SAM-dependent methyltransferase
MKTPYSSRFYEGQQQRSIASANIVVPEVLSLFSIDSVLDVGCGTGGWLQAFAQHGISDYLGVDGDYVPRGMLKIPVDRFRALDIANLADLGRVFDLACSLEVGEHLPESAARCFVAALVCAAPVVLFSAAIPHQGGTAHLNEQWQAYWAAFFAQHGYVAVDCIRPRIYGNNKVEWWYRQNILIYCRPEKCPKGLNAITSAYELNRVDPAMISHLLTPSSGREALKTIRRMTTYLIRPFLTKLSRIDFRRVR